MSIKNIRAQYAVGQGSFHSSELYDDENLRLRYVYDCGAMSKYAKARNARIDAYLAAVGTKQTLDFLFISHAHADHLNGVERLLDRAGGLAVKTIVMPLLNVEERLVAFARAASEDAESAQSSFYQAFVADPISALGRFNPEQIIFVEPGDRNGGAPFRGGPDGPNAGSPDFDRAILGREQNGWKIVGDGTVRPVRDGSSGPTVLAMSDTLALTVTSADSAHSWLLAPFVDPATVVRKNLFISTLAKAMGQTVTDLTNWLRSSTNLEELLTTYVSDLRRAYAAIAPDLNVTSMCLYSGPVPSPSTPTSRYWSKVGSWTVSDTGKSGVAWLGTGDAAFANKKRRTDFFKHYGTLLDRVLTLALPHHGSDHNFDRALLQRIQPSFCIAAADALGSWKHPGPKVGQAVASAGRFVSIVTSNIASEVCEHVSLI